MLNDLIDSPLFIFLLNLMLLSLSAWIGASVLRGHKELDREARENLGWCWDSLTASDRDLQR